MNPPSIQWNDLAAALNITERSDVMPFTLDCLLCKAAKSLTIYQNTTHNAGWHYCKACGKNGDLFDLASSILGMSTESTFVELAKRGVHTLINMTPASIQAYNDTQVRIRTKAGTGWSKCELYFKKPTAAVNELLVLFNLQLKKWENFNPRPSRYIGAVHAKELEKELGSQFKHISTYKAKKKEYEYTGTLPIRFQKGWNDILVLPYETAPGLITGFLCVGHRHGKLQRQFTRTHIGNNTFGSKLKDIDAGLWGLHTAVHGKSTYSDYAIALEDPLLALRIQSRHALLSGSPLPIVSWLFVNNEATQMPAWSAVPQKNIVVVTTKLTPSSVHAAYTSGGLLTILDTTEAGLLEQIKSKKPEDLIKNFIRRALPWRDAVRKWMTTVSPNVATDLFNTLTLYCKDAAAIEQEFKNELNITPARSVKCTRTFFGKTAYLLVENNDGWFIRVDTTDYIQMTNFTIRLNTIHVKNKQQVGEGLLYFKDTVLPVSFTKQEMKNHVAFEERVVQYFLDNGLGYPKINTDSIPLLRLTRLFHEPKMYTFPQLIDANDLNLDLLPVD